MKKKYSATILVSHTQGKSLFIYTSNLISLMSLTSLTILCCNSFNHEFLKTKFHANKLSFQSFSLSHDGTNGVHLNAMCLILTFQMTRRVCLATCEFHSVVDPNIHNVVESLLTTRHRICKSTKIIDFESQRRNRSREDKNKHLI